MVLDLRKGNIVLAFATHTAKQKALASQAKKAAEMEEQKGEPEFQSIHRCSGQGIFANRPVAAHLAFTNIEAQVL